MEQLNRYYRCSKISERKTRQVIRYFAHDLTASKTAELTGLTRRSVTVLFVKIRQRISEECERASPFAGEVALINFNFATEGRGTLTVFRAAVIMFLVKMRQRIS